MVNIDTAGLAALEELHEELVSRGIQVRAQTHSHLGVCRKTSNATILSFWLKLEIAPLPPSLSEKKHTVQMAIASLGWKVVHKMKLARLVDGIGEAWIFLTVGQAVEACLGNKKGADLEC